MSFINLATPLYSAATFDIYKAVKNNLGRFIYFDDSKDIFNNIPTKFNNIEQFSLKEKNILADVLNNISNKPENLDDINHEPFNPVLFVDLFNKYCEKIPTENQINETTQVNSNDTLSQEKMNIFKNGTNIISDIPLFLKKLNSLSEYLKAEPYNDLNFSYLIYEKFIQSEFGVKYQVNKLDSTGRNRNPIKPFEFDFDLVKNGFKNYVDKNTILDYFSEDSVTALAAKEHLTQVELLTKKDNSRSYIANTIAAVFALGTIFIAYNSLYTDATALAQQAIEYAQHITQYLSNFKPNTELTTNFTTLGLAGYTFSKTFNLANSSYEKIQELKSERQHLINKFKPKNVQSDFMNVTIRKNLFESLLNDFSLNTSNEDNQNYMALILSIHDKLIQDTKAIEYSTKKALANESIDADDERAKSKTIEPLLLKKLNLDKKTISRLNNLNKDDIHEISNIASPEARFLMLTREFRTNDLYMLKALSNIKALSDKKTELVNIDKFKNTKIENMFLSINSSDIGKYDKFNKNEQIIAKFYASILTEREINAIPSGAMKTKTDFFAHINDYIKRTDTLKKEEISKDSKQNTFSYLKKLFYVVTGKNGYEYDLSNIKVIDKLKEISTEFNLNNFEHIDNMNSKSKIGLDKVFLKIDNIRNKITDSIKNKIAPT